MPLKSKRRHVEDVYFNRAFQVDNGPGGFSFPCDKDGNVDRTQLTELGLANLEWCLKGGPNIRDEGAVEFVNKYTIPAVWTCKCGCDVELDDPLDNPCQCGKCYNMSGQEVIPSWLCDAQGEPIDD